MAAPFLSIAAKAFDPLLNNATQMTGGNNEDTGFSGADWHYWAHATSFNNGPSRKTQGNEQINWNTDIVGGQTPITASNDSYRAITFEEGDTLTSISAISPQQIHTGGVILTSASSQLNQAIVCTLPVKKEMNTFWWLGRQRNGDWRASISISDGSFATQTYDLPKSPVAFQWIDAWWEAKYRGTPDQEEAGVTITLRINRQAVWSGQATAYLGANLSLLRVPEPYINPVGPILMAF